MKMEMNRIQRGLLVVIGGLSVLLAVVLLYKGYGLIQNKKQEKEWAVRHAEVEAQLNDIRLQIQEFSGDAAQLQAFLNEHVEYEVIVLQEADKEALPQEALPQEALQQEAVEGDMQAVVSAAIVIEPPETEEPAGQPFEEIQAQPEAAVSENGVSGNSVSEDSVSEDSVSEDSVSEDSVSENSVPENMISDEADRMNTVSGNAVENGVVIPYVPREMEVTLAQKRAVRSSYEETRLVNEADKAFLSEHSYDFSGMKLACLGDSITEGSNMENMENYQQYAYPSVLKNILQAESVCNLGIGGSSYGRYWDQAFVDRYKEIPQDTDIILVMGGTNDGFAASQKELGSLEEKAPRTYYGDVDELMRGLKADYPNAKIIFITPLPNVLHDYLRGERDYLLPQNVFADAVKELAQEHQIDVIDLYNSNILDTHDAQVISDYMPDGVHCNPAGYEILAEHIACGVIQAMESGKQQENTVSGSILPPVSGNAAESETFIDAAGKVKEKKIYE